jgi:5-aminopentanamidase
MPAVATSYRVTIAYANCCGIEVDLTYVDASPMVGARSEVLVQAGSCPALLIVDLLAACPSRLST